MAILYYINKIYYLIFSAEQTRAYPKREALSALLNIISLIPYLSWFDLDSVSLGQIIDLATGIINSPIRGDIYSYFMGAKPTLKEIARDIKAFEDSFYPQKIKVPMKTGQLLNWDIIHEAVRQAASPNEVILDLKNSRVRTMNRPDYYDFRLKNLFSVHPETYVWSGVKNQFWYQHVQMETIYKELDNPPIIKKEVVEEVVLRYNKDAGGMRRLFNR